MSEELEVIQSIYPELQIDDCDATIDILVSLEEAICVRFDSRPSLEVTHLPPLQLALHLPQDYPNEKPPELTIHCEWLSLKHIAELKHECIELWRPGDETLWSIMDLLHTKASCAFDRLFNGEIHLNDEMFEVLTLYEEVAKRLVFERQSFECEICLDWRGGRDCIALGCGHIFCISCLSSMFKLHIKEGSVELVRCPLCPMSKPLLVSGPALLDVVHNSHQKLVLNQIPADILSRVVTSEEVTRYHSLLRKKELEALPNSTHCPRDFCETALARNPDEKLVICTSCQYAFCADCRKTWHGPMEPCRRLKYSSTLGELYNSIISDSARVLEKTAMERLYGKKNLLKLIQDLEDERLADKWRMEHAQACPVCSTFVEKSQGCNHMICSICQSHFCFLCGEGLSSRNPYSHYNDAGLPCHQKLFEGLTGIEDPFDGLIM